MPHYSKHVDDMKAVADILRKPHNRERLFTTCFADEIGIQMRRTENKKRERKWKRKRFI